MKKNVIIVLIDGGRLDFAQKSETFQKLKSTMIHFDQSITYAPILLEQCMLYYLVVMGIELV